LRELLRFRPASDEAFFVDPVADFKLLVLRDRKGGGVGSAEKYVER